MSKPIIYRCEHGVFTVGEVCDDCFPMPSTRPMTDPTPKDVVMKPENVDMKSRHVDAKDVADQELERMANMWWLTEADSTTTKQDAFKAGYRARAAINPQPDLKARGDVAVLVEALEACRDMADHNYELEKVARSALAAYREKGGE